MTSDFARRHGYRENEPVFRSPDDLPKHIREHGGRLMLGNMEDDPDGKLFAQVLLRVFPPSPDLLDWYSTIPVLPLVLFWMRKMMPTSEGVYSNLREHLLRPLVDCDWRLYYAVVETVCAEWSRAGVKREGVFSLEFNLLLGAYGIPWELHGGLVIPAADYEFAEDLKHARSVAHPRIADQIPDHHELIRHALDAFYRKQPGPDLSAACVHGWGAWKAVAGAVSGYDARDGRAFDHVDEKHPELHSAMKAWQKLAEAGRHPETGNQLTESEARFIVMLCVNAVRFLCPTCDAESVN